MEEREVITCVRPYALDETLLGMFQLLMKVVGSA